VSFFTDLNRRNLFVGGNYSLYIATTLNAPMNTSYIQVYDNQWTTTFWPNGGQFGPVTGFDTTKPGNYCILPFHSPLISSKKDR
jgi:hypothetical protein